MKRSRLSKKRPPLKLRDVLRKAWQDYEVNGGVPHDQFWEELAKEMPARKKKRAGAQ
jgi:hypothetical protein